MPQDQSPDLRVQTAPGVESTAAQLFDPVAFARRVEDARAQRAEALARRAKGAAPGALAPDGATRAATGDPADRPDRVRAAALAAFARPVTTAHVPPPAPADATRAHSAEPRPEKSPIPPEAPRAVSAPAPAPTGSAAPRAAIEPLVAPPRLPGPPRARGASRAAAVLLLVGVVVAATPPLRGPVLDLAAALSSGGVPGAATLAEPAPPPTPGPSPKVPALSEGPPELFASLEPADAETLATPPRIPAADAPAAPPQPASLTLAKIAAAPEPAPADASARSASGSPAATPLPLVLRPAGADAPAATPPPRVADPVADAPSEPAAAALPTTAARSIDIPRPVAARQVVGDPAAAPSPILSVAVHAPSGVSDATLADIVADLSASDFPASGVRVRVPIEQTHVRYFHAADAPQARRLAAALGSNAEARDFTHFSPPPAPGRLEVWLSGTPAVARQRATPPSAPAASPAPASAPVAATRAVDPATPAPRLVIGRQGSADRSRPASALLDRLYARPDPAPAPQPAPPPVSAPIGDRGLY